MMSHDPVVTDSNTGHASLNVPDPEVVVKAERRHFTAEYKQRILQEADTCTQRGEVGALLRREGLYSSHLNTWRQQRQRGGRQGLTPAKRGRKADPQAAEIARLQRETVRLKAQLERAELIIDVQKKFAKILDESTTVKAEVK
jgi:transposase